MSSFRTRIMEAETAAERMDALCEFIEFWLGPVRPLPGDVADLPAAMAPTDSPIDARVCLSTIMANVTPTSVSVVGPAFLMARAPFVTVTVGGAMVD